MNRGMAVPAACRLVLQDYQMGLSFGVPSNHGTREYVDIIYKDDGVVQIDVELQRWWTEYRTVKGGHALTSKTHLRGRSGTRRKAFQRFSQSCNGFPGPCMDILDSVLQLGQKTERTQSHEAGSCKTITCRYGSPGRTIVEGNEGSLTAFGKPCVSRQNPVWIYVFLITDGAVADERNICLSMQSRIIALGARAPRISTFGIGHFCNYYFLKMLAVIGRGISDVAFTSGKIQGQMERMLVAAATPVLTNIGLQRLPEGCEIYPFPIPDLFCGNPLVVSGKFHGIFPDSITVVGLMPDHSTWTIEVPSRKTSNVPLSKVFAKQQLDLLTGQAWLYGDRRRE